MTILQIEYFVEIVKCGSFTKAAEKLFITHQALSIQIQALEKELGIPLFDRSNRRKIALLEYGEILYKVWEPMIEQHRKAVEEAQILYDKEKNTLRVGVLGVPYIRKMTIPVISRYAEKHNQKPVFVVDTPERLLSRLDSGEMAEVDLR
ncbi:MAG: LysR family transcriptional regulator [Lachnospiraceae bacterium]|nr:LysR family transcriptional regulator [Lachnospiraceae bacterium]